MRSRPAPGFWPVVLLAAVVLSGCGPAAPTGLKPSATEKPPAPTEPEKPKSTAPTHIPG